MSFISCLAVSCLPDSPWSSYFCISICVFDKRLSSSRLNRFVFIGKDLYQSPQLGVLDWSGTNVHGHTKLAIWFFRSASLLSMVWSWGFGRDASGWAPWLGRPTGWALYSSQATWWAPWLDVASSCFYSKVEPLSGLCNYLWFLGLLGSNPT